MQSKVFQGWITNFSAQLLKNVLALGFKQLGSKMVFLFESPKAQHRFLLEMLVLATKKCRFWLFSIVLIWREPQINFTYCFLVILPLNHFFFSKVTMQAGSYTANSLAVMDHIAEASVFLPTNRTRDPFSWCLYRRSSYCASLFFQWGKVIHNLKTSVAGNRVQNQ